MSLTTGDRRKIVHRSGGNLTKALNLTKNAIDSQLSSGALNGWSDTLGDTQSIQGMLGTQIPAFDAWYTAWRGAEPPEPPEADCLGVFGSFSKYQSELMDTTSIPRLARNNFAAMTLLAGMYENLYTIGLALETTAPGLKEVAKQGLEAVTPIFRSLSETVCTAAVRDLHNQDGSISMANASTAIGATQPAWGW